MLIPGAGGGIATAAIQIAKLAGACVYATTSTPKKMQQVRELGADEVINYREEDVTRAIWNLTGKRGVDVVFDSVGAATLDTSIRVLKRGGRLVTCGATSGSLVETNLNLIFWKQISLIGATASTHAEFRQVMELIFSERLKPVVDRVLPLSEGREGQRALEAGEQFGKIVLEP